MCSNVVKYLKISHIKVKKPLQDEPKLLSDTEIVWIPNTWQSLPDSSRINFVPTTTGTWDLIAMGNYVGSWLVDWLGGMLVV